MIGALLAGLGTAIDLVVLYFAIQIALTVIGLAIGVLTFLLWWFQ